MADVEFTLVVAATLDGYIARAPNHPTHEWASDEEQAQFFARVEAADWAVMGRNTHQAADRPDRRRIVFSSRYPRPEWRRPTQLWLDPAGLGPADLPGLVREVRPLRKGVILGGTRVHDWFLSHRSIHAVALSVEPVRFGAGLPIFSGTGGRNPLAAMQAAGFVAEADEVLNAAGTRLVTLRPVEAG